MRGEGRYTDDINLPGQAYAVIVRSSARPRHRSKSIDTDAARKMKGVLGGLHRRRPDAAGYGTAPSRRRAVQEPRRLRR